MSTKNAILLGCGGIVLFGVLLVALVLVWVVSITKDVEGVAVVANSPLDVKAGETFDLTVEVTNEREKKHVSLASIDISEAYLSGFVLVSTEPTPKSSMHVPFDDSMSFTFEVAIPPGESRTFTFKLRAESAGIYRGDVDVCEGQRFITTLAQTVVKEE